MSERTVLEISLWVFTGGFLVKSAVFGALTLIMRRQRNETAFGAALRWHYISLAAQAAVLAFLYLYYSTSVSGNGGWLDAPERIAVYIVATALVIWATVMGVRLLVAYFLTASDSEHEPPPAEESAGAPR